MSAWAELSKKLEPGEIVEAGVIGHWAGNEPWEFEDDGTPKPDWREPTPVPVPFSVRGKVLTAERLEVHLSVPSSTFHGGFGSVKTYAVWIWTNRRVFFIGQYDGSSWLDSVPRNPTAGFPEMPGG